MRAASVALTTSLAALAVLVVGAFVGAVAWVDRSDGQSAAAHRRRLAVVALVTAAWLPLTAGAAAAGRLRFDGRPPTTPLLLGAVLPRAVSLGLSPLGARMGSRCRC